MAVSPEQLLHAVQTMELQLNVIKQAMADMGIREEGIIGTFDGEFMILDNGKRYQIPPNYASKSMLVPGDTLRLVEDPAGGQPKFKQIAKAERGKATGLLTKKDGKFEVLCEEGSFKVLTAAVKHFEGEVGDTATIQFAKNHPKNSWAAVEKVVKAGSTSSESNITSSPEEAIPVFSTESIPEPVAPPPVNVAPTQPIPHVTEVLAADPAVEVSVAAPVETAEVAISQPASEPVIVTPQVEVVAKVEPIPAPGAPSADNNRQRQDNGRDRRDDRGSRREGSNRDENREGNRGGSSREGNRDSSSRDSRGGKGGGSRNASRSHRDDRPRNSSSDAPRSSSSHDAPRNYASNGASRSAPPTDPIPEPLLSNQSGEIPVATVMDEDDLQ